ncbi:Hypothetical secreted protein [Ligilactobacillus ruminis ATCC 27782]|uniref:Hypothetical secreted protein n=1 Tax=Ligilactobacillus ruminis (strain ATCC 27782 / RF3) TaxID=1069534 RepID=G2SPL7_LIGR2|nr:Hypothetical secreted protein [Ligilactobacillus ruminis ATCC 27782]
MRRFSRFLSTFGAACPEFGVSGRQKSDISPVFCLLSVSHAPFSTNQEPLAAFRPGFFRMTNTASKA